MADERITAEEVFLMYPVGCKVYHKMRKNQGTITKHHLEGMYYMLQIRFESEEIGRMPEIFDTHPKYLRPTVTALGNKV